MAMSSNLGFPRIGAKRELKKSTEAFWAGKTELVSLVAAGSQIREANWQLQKQLGIEWIPSNDFSFYDQMLDTCLMTGAIPPRYEKLRSLHPLELYFAMARGRQAGSEESVTAMEMTKWFDTNYHYLVPEFYKGQTFSLTSRKAVEEFKEALALGIKTRPVLMGPCTFLLLGKSKQENFSPLSLLGQLLPVYAQVLEELNAAGAEWVQIDEPCLILDRRKEELKQVQKAYQFLSTSSKLKIMLAGYFEGYRDNLTTILELPVSCVHFDLIRSPSQLEQILELGVTGSAKEKFFSLGVVDGRNIWKNVLAQSLETLKKAKEKLGSERILVAPSCSLLHSPIDLEMEKKMKPDMLQWLSFAKQKLQEIVTLAKALNFGEGAVKEALEQNKKDHQARRTSNLIHRPEVKKRCAEINKANAKRKSSYAERRKIQSQKLKLPLFPTTTIGSFPQTAEVRSMRAKFRKGEINQQEYEAFVEKQIKQLIQTQQELGLDMLVHGEFERNDMVEYFGEQLSGFLFTENGWVQSYGSRYVKPPIIYGDVKREEPMTVRWSKFAQSQTDKIVKGMLTGPVTILQWSFVRDDQPRSETCKQIALALRDEVMDLEAAGIKAIQIDEPAFREGLPLRKSDWKEYLQWACFCFRLTSSGVSDETQIHTHMCYGEFNDILSAIAEMDADVISIESSRSQMELLEAFKKFKYPNEIGPGVYDIHSPRIPPEDEMVALLQKANQVLKPEQVWVNPDCGLKTRNWDEVLPALKNMVTAARKLRESVLSRKS